MIAEGQTDARCSWDEEPGEFRWIFHRVDDLDVVELAENPVVSGAGETRPTWTAKRSFEPRNRRCTSGAVVLSAANVCSMSTARADTPRSGSSIRSQPKRSLVSVERLRRVRTARSCRSAQPIAREFGNHLAIKRGATQREVKSLRGQAPVLTSLNALRAPSRDGRFAAAKPWTRVQFPPPPPSVATVPGRRAVRVK